MAQVKVTQKFMEDFKTWESDRLHWKDFTQSEMDGFKDLLRIELRPGPDQIRQGLTVIEDGKERSANIDDVEERIRMWSNYFAICADEIRARHKKAA